MPATPERDALLESRSSELRSGFGMVTRNARTVTAFGVEGRERPAASRCVAGLGAPHSSLGCDPRVRGVPREAHVVACRCDAVKVEPRSANPAKTPGFAAHHRGPWGAPSER